MKNIITYNILLLVCLSGNCQLNDTLELIITEYNRIVFIEDDRVYLYTKFVEPDGSYSFSQGFDDSYSSISGIFHQFDKRRSLTGTYRLGFRFVPDIDTVDLLYSLNKEDFIDNPERIPYEFVASEILQKFDEGSILNTDQNIIRILYPCLDSRHPHFYHVFSVIFSEESTSIFRSKGFSRDYHGMQLIQKDSALLNEREVKRIEKHFQRISGFESLDCRRPSTPWILEYNIQGAYRRFIISDYCSYNNKTVRPIYHLIHSIIAPSNKYFGPHCVD